MSTLYGYKYNEHLPYTDLLDRFIARAGDDIQDYTFPSGISDEGIAAIREYCYFHLGFILPDDFSFDWVITKGKFTGTLPKRISNYAYKSHGKRLTPAEVSQIGNLASNYSTNGALIHWDYTSRIDWDRGDFGDSGSCYWGCHESAKRIITDAGGGAIRLWSEDSTGWDGRTDKSNDSDKRHKVSRHYQRTIRRGEDYTTLYGAGRCWVVPLAGYPHVFAIFNAYGDYQLIKLARAISDMLGVSYKRVRLWDHTDNEETGTFAGDQSGDVWINGGVGYLIGDASEIGEVSLVKMEISDDRRLETCEYCGDEIDLDDDEYQEYGGEYYCQTCWDENYAHCGMCGSVCSQDDLTYATVRGYGEDYFCEYCLRDYTRCEDCEVYYPDDDVITFEGSCYCEDCISDHAIPCEHCGEYLSPDDAIEIDDCLYCQSCGEEIRYTCSDCGREVFYHGYDRDSLRDAAASHGMCVDCLNRHRIGRCANCERDIYEGEDHRYLVLTVYPDGVDSIPFCSFCSDDYYVNHYQGYYQRHPELVSGAVNRFNAH